MNSDRVTMLEVMMLAVSVVSATAVLFMPFLVARTAAQDAWLSVPLAGLISIIPAWCAGVIMSRFPEQSIIQALPRLLGKLLGKGVGLLLLGFFLFGSVLIIWQLEEFIVGSLMPETPEIAIRLLFLTAVAYATFNGAIPLLRTNVYVMIAGIVVIGLVLGLPITRMNPGFLLPVLEDGPRPMIDGALLLGGWLCQVPLIIMMFQRFVDKKFTSNAPRKAVLAVTINTLLMLMGALGTLAAFGPAQTATMYFPSFAVTRIIAAGAFLEHIEVTFVAVWIGGMFVTAVAYIMSFSDGLADWLGIKRNLWMYAILYLSLIIWPLLFDLNIEQLVYLLGDVAPWIALALGGILPILLLFRALMLPLPKKESPEDSREEDLI